MSAQKGNGGVSGTPGKVFQIYTVQHDVSPPLKHMLSEHLPPRQRPLLPTSEPIPVANSAPDTALQSSPGPATAAVSGTSFDGLGNGFPGITVNVAPPDPNLALSSQWIIQWVNTSLAIWDRSNGNALVAGFPKPGNSIWSGVGGPCETTNDGDPIVQYDRLDDRWVFTQLANTSGPTYYQCVAVSTTNDPTGPYNRYALTFSSLNDYPKLGVWSDAFYLSFNMFLPFLGTYFFQGAQICAMDKNAMIAGAASAAAQCSQLSSSYGSLLPSDVDGATPPPAGEPGLFLNFGTNSLRLWKLHPDFSNVNNATVTGPISISVSGFSPACSGKTCIPQPNTTQQLDSLADRLMYRLAYRNFGDHESLVVNHSIVAGSSVGVRWYEIRNPNATPTVFQQGTFAPDSNYRWMGSAAMDKAGNIGLGYSLSSSSIYPSIDYTGWQTTDTPGVMESEALMFSGSGSQAGTQALSRWGDYTALRIDPADDCTFWYTNEYLKTTGTFNWSTRIGSFSFPACSGPVQPDFSLSASPGSQTVTQGGGTSYTVSLNPLNGYAGTASLSVSGLPTGASGSFNPTSISAGTSSILSVSTSGGTPSGSYTLTIAGTDTVNTALTHNTTVQLVVNPTLSSLSLNPATVNGGSSSTGTVVLSGPATAGGAVVTLSSSSPSVASVPRSVTVPAGQTSATFPVSTSPVGSNTQVTIFGTYGVQQSAVLTVNAAPAFTLASSPSSLSIARGRSGTATITVNPVNGFNSSVSFSATTNASRTTISFSPNPSLTSTTMTVNVSRSAKTGNYSITVTGTGGGVTSTVQVPLTVR